MEEPKKLVNEIKRIRKISWDFALIVLLNMQILEKIYDDSTKKNIARALQLSAKSMKELFKPI